MTNKELLRVLKENPFIRRVAELELKAKAQDKVIKELREYIRKEFEANQ